MLAKVPPNTKITEKKASFIPFLRREEICLINTRLLSPCLEGLCKWALKHSLADGAL
jgi:hypothetical protein